MFLLRQATSIIEWTGYEFDGFDIGKLNLENYFLTQGLVHIM